MQLQNIINLIKNKIWLYFCGKYRVGICGLKGHEFWLFYPSLKAKNEYISRMGKRDNPAAFVELIQKNYGNWINEMANNLKAARRVEIRAGKYLEDAFKQAKSKQYELQAKPLILT